MALLYAPFLTTFVSKSSTKLLGQKRVPEAATSYPMGHFQTPRELTIQQSDRRRGPVHFPHILNKENGPPPAPSGRSSAGAAGGLLATIVWIEPWVVGWMVEAGGG